MLLVTLSNKVVVGDALEEASRPIMTDLANRYGLTIHLGILEGGMVTYVAKVSTKDSWAPHTRLGSQLEAYCSAIGKVLLSALTPEDLDAFVVGDDLVALTPHTITNPAQLRKELKTIRQRGYAIDDREMCLHTRCLAMPVHNADGHVIAAMSTTDHADQMTASRLAELHAPLHAAIQELETKVFSFCS